MDFITYVLIVSTIILILMYSRRPKNFPPGPVSIPLLGSLPALALSKEKTQYDMLWAMSRHYGPVIGIFLGTIPAVVVNGYETVKNVLSREDCSNRPNIVPVTMKSFGKAHGVFFTNGELWREQRRFTLRNLRDFGFGKRSMEYYIHEEARGLIAYMETMTPDPKHGVDLLSVLPVVAINVLWTILAGRRHELDDQEFRKLTRSVMTLFREGNAFNPVTFSPILQRVPLINAPYNRQLAAVKVVKSLVSETINEHLKTYDESQMRDFIDVFIKEMKAHPTSNYTSNQLTAICLDLFNAGTETTSSTLGFALRYLLQNPQVQIKMRNELHTVVGKDRLPSMDDMQRLHYTQAVISETLRHSAIAAFTVPHAAMKDTKIMDYDIPKGTFILINLWSVHMEPKIWGDPENFRPERFISEEGVYKKNDQFIPFSAGPRMCLGEPLARFSVLLFLASLVQNFTFESVHGAPPSNETLKGFTKSPAPYRMHIHRLK